MTSLIRKALIDDDYLIQIKSNSLYIKNFNKINQITDINLKVTFPNFILKIEGENLVIIKMLDTEMLLGGIIKKAEMIYE